jgi:3-deoxy-7-phosphoheptulonate synthase
MIIVTRPDVTDAEISAIVARVSDAGLTAHVSRGERRVVIGCVGDEAVLAELPLAALPGVESVTPVLRPYKLASREFSAAPDRATVVVLGRGGGGPSAVTSSSRLVDAVPCAVGGQALAVIAGPCSVEGPAMLLETAHAVRASGAAALRGGVYKPRTSPYAFQGLGAPGLSMLADTRAATGLPIVTEVMDPRQVESVAAVADCLQIGARNMQNFSLLTEVGDTHVPILLKRGLSATVRELLMAAEYILARGNRNVILCERGIRTFETSTRNTLDVAAIPVLKSETHLPVIVDPSHAAGFGALVPALAFAAIAAGADGLIVEVHPNPADARSDGEQSLTFAEFAALMRRLVPFAEAAGRTLVLPVDAMAETSVGA